MNVTVSQTINRAPVAHPDNAVVRYQTPADIDVLANDTDPDDDEDPLTITGAQNGSFGTVQIVANGGGQRVRYTPASGFSGADSFTYTIADRFGASAVGTVNVTVSPPPPPSTALYTTGAAVRMQAIPQAACRQGRHGKPSACHLFRTMAASPLKPQSRPRRVAPTPSTWDRLTMQGASGKPEYIVARKGEIANGADGSIFASFKDPLLNDHGTIVFLATLDGTSRLTNGGIWKHYDSQGRTAPTLVARKGAQAVGVPGRWKAFTSVALADGAPGSELIAFTATMVMGANGTAGPGGVTASNDFGLWIANAGAITLALREGQTVMTSLGSKKIKSFVALKAVPGAPGQGHGVTGSGVLVCTTFTDGTRAVLRCLADGTHRVVALHNDALAGTSETMHRFGVPTQGNTGEAAFIASLSGEINANSAAVVERAEGLFNILRKGARPLSGDDASINSFSAIATDSSGHLALTVQLKGGTATPANDVALFAVNEGVELIAREGSQPPGLGAGAKWHSFPSLALPEDGSGPIFVGKLFVPTAGAPNPAGVTVANNIGIWGVDAAGALRLIVRTADQLDATRTIKAFTFLEQRKGVANANPFL